MPDALPSGGFSISALPQYNPLDPRLFVRDPNRILEGVNQGLALARNIRTFNPGIAAQNAQSQLTTKQALAQLDLVDKQHDVAQSALDLEKSKAALVRQKQEADQEQYDQAAQLQSSWVNPQALNVTGQQIPQGALASVPAQGVPTGPQSPLGALSSLQVGGGGPQAINAAPANPETGFPQGALMDIRPTPDQLIQMEMNQRDPAIQAKEALVRAQIAEQQGLAAQHGALAQSIANGSGRYGAQTQLLETLRAAKIPVTDVINQDAFNQDVQNDTFDGNYTKYIDPAKVTAALKASKSEDTQAKIDVKQAGAKTVPTAADKADEKLLLDLTNGGVDITPFLGEDKKLDPSKRPAAAAVQKALKDAFTITGPDGKVIDLSLNVGSNPTATTPANQAPAKAPAFSDWLNQLVGK